MRYSECRPLSISTIVWFSLTHTLHPHAVLLPGRMQRKPKPESAYVDELEAIKKKKAKKNLAKLRTVSSFAMLAVRQKVGR